MEAITPQIIFYIFNLPVTSTVVSTWISMGLIILLIAILRKFAPDLLENISDFLAGMVSGIMSETDIDRYLPLLGTLAIFIVVANSIGIVPVLTAPTSDINTTIALSLVVLISVNFFGMQKKGFRNYLKEISSPIILLPFEIIGQLSRTLSLSLRLFGNIISGELISAIVFGLIPLIAPLPFVALGLFLGVLQAYVFTALTALYIDLAIAK